MAERIGLQEGLEPALRGFLDALADLIAEDVLREEFLKRQSHDRRSLAGSAESKRG